MAAALMVRGALLCGSIIVIRKLTGVLNKAFLKDKIHTEASQREREDQSATTTSTMMNLEEVGREFERSVIDEGQGILMDKIHMEASQREREDESATTTSKMMNLKEVGGEFVRSVIDEGNQILKRLDDLLGRTSFLGLIGRVPPRPLQRLQASLVAKESDVVGRDRDKEEIIELLLSADTGRKNLSVIPIVGMGGIGKTTLAQLVYRDSRVQKHFDLRAWVTISEDFDVFQITKRIYEEVTSQECKTKELYVLQSKLNEALAGKRFLFVLDDVWNENYQRWESLESGFQTGADGNTIIVTTRSEVVASTMSNVATHKLKLVSVDDCWQIFAKHVFVVNQATTELQEIGLEIVKRCKGLPLAVKSVAGLLRSTSNPEEWRKILNSDIWKLQFRENLKNDIVPAMWLSYHLLPPILKRCFAYCSIFPKDYEFKESGMEKIILLWMAEGLLTPVDGERMEDVGKAYLQALISRSFFQPSGTDESAMVMHDLVHDLAMFISGEFCFSCGDSNDLSNLGTKSRHLSYRKGRVDLMKLGAVSQSREKKLMSLRTLLALPLSHELVPDKPVLKFHNLFLKVGGCLRVLSLCESSITELPDSIGNMKYLRYLDLSRTSIKKLPDSVCSLYNLQTLLLSRCRKLARLPARLAGLFNLRYLDIKYTSLKELPDSICTLYNLQTLLLSRCRKLAQLPTRLAALVNLRHLDIIDTPLKEMPPQMCRMRSLERLSNFVVGEKDGWRIKELGEFSLLEGSLCISGLEYIVDVKDVLEANLKDKKLLSKLTLEWGWRGRRSSQQEREVLEALQPHKNLKELTIFRYRGQIFPDWVGHESFCNMLQVELVSCGNVCMLPPLGQLSSLRRLVIRDLNGVVSIGNEFCASSSTTTNHSFTSLEYLFIDAMESWEEWSFSSDRLGQEGGVFPSLEYLKVRRCKKLIVGLPDCHLPSLTSIEIWGCNEMKGVFVCQSRQEMDTNAFPSLQSIVDCGRAFQHLTALEFLLIMKCGELECLPQEGLPLSLSVLTIIECPVLEKRCQRGRGEDWPKIQHIPQIRIW